MVMDDTEIRNSYNQAKDKKEQVKVLADLNCVSPSEMRAHLVDLEDGEPLDWFRRHGIRED